MLLSVDEALERVREFAVSRAAVKLPVREALGLVLAEDVASDVDSPPHDKAMIDGYAIRTADVNSAAGFTIIEEVAAGAVPTKNVGAGQAVRIMTGAPLPEGADAVVMWERTEVAEGGRVRLQDAQVAAGQNIVRRAASMRRGEVVLTAGSEIRPIESGLLAEVGRTAVSVYPRASVAVLCTGNEVVPADRKPGPGQIRNSNGPLLVASAVRLGAQPADLGIARDETNVLRERIKEGLKADVLVLSGGVSAGAYDLVPPTLESLGVAKVFHKVNLKPGKPIWFGVFRDGAINRLVFGLPGNPVSSLVCFELFVRPAIARLMGKTNDELRRVTAMLTSEFVHRGDRPTYHPSRLEDTNEQRVTPLSWRGSSDLRTLAAANALACFEPGDRSYAAGERVDVLML